MGFQKGNKIRLGIYHSKETKLKMSESHKGNTGMLGKHHSDETKKILSQKKIGENHPMFGIHRYGEESARWKGGRTLDISGYILIFKPEHPHANNQGYILEHRLEMERCMGRYLTFIEVVHHINNIRADNRIENLMLFANNEEHLKYHRKLKVS